MTAVLRVSCACDQKTVGSFFCQCLAVVELSVRCTYVFPDAFLLKFCLFFLTPEQRFKCVSSENGSNLVVSSSNLLYEIRSHDKLACLNTQT